MPLPPAQMSSQPALLGAGVVLLATALVYLARLPGRVAQRRAQRCARAIAVMGWISLVVWPLWPVAMALAYRRRPRARQANKFRVRVTCDDVLTHRLRRQAEEQARDNVSQ